MTKVEDLKDEYDKLLGNDGGYYSADVKNPKDVPSVKPAVLDGFNGKVDVANTYFCGTAGVDFYKNESSKFVKCDSRGHGFERDF